MIFQSADFECAFSSYRLPDEKIIPIFAAVMAKCLSYLVFALCLFLWDFSFSTAEGDMACMPSTTADRIRRYVQGLDGVISVMHFFRVQSGTRFRLCVLSKGIQLVLDGKMVCGRLQPCGCRREERNSRIHRFPAMPNYILYIR